MSATNSKLLLRTAGRTAATFAAIASLTGSVVVSCSGDPASSTGTGGGSTRPASHAMSQWSPDTRFADECPQSLHDTYFVIGPDGKKYPTWHPPSTTDPATSKKCFFGHEHGQDPSASAMWTDLRRHFAFDTNNNGTIDTDELNASGIPFGYVAEQLDAFNTAANIPAANGRRWQDHTGYKIALSNGVPRSQLLSNGQTQTIDLFCDVLLSYHQSTDDADAFASNLHQVTYAIDCNRGTESSRYPAKLIVSGLATFGDPNSFQSGPVDGATVVVLTAGIVSAVPSNLRNGAGEKGRQIPDTGRAYSSVFVASGAASDFDAGLRERWRMGLTMRQTSGAELAFFDPAFDVLDPARLWDAGLFNGLRRSVDLCYTGLNANGQLVTEPGLATTIVRKVRGQTSCLPLGTDDGRPATQLSARIAFDALTSPFKGCEREVIVGDQRVSNAGGQTTWYTDPFGQQARTASFAGSVKQFIASTNTASANLILAPRMIDARPSGGCGSQAGVHVPN